MTLLGSAPASKLPSQPTTFSWAQLAAYGALRMPLALLELPLYLFLPALYGGHFGISLTIISAVLFATRLLDAITDPLLGGLIAAKRQQSDYRRWIWLGLPFLALGFTALLKPQAQWAPLVVWLTLGSMISYFAYSLISIAYQAWGAEISADDAQAARIAGVREGFGLLGVVLAAAFLAVEKIPVLIALFIAMAGISAYFIRFAPDKIQSKPQALSSNITEQSNPSSLLSSLRLLVPDRRFHRLLSVFLVNGIATAIPATLVLFFVNDVLLSPTKAPMFLLTYFLAGAFGMPLWIWLAKRFGLEITWLIGMMFAVIAFAWAVGLRAGDSTQFFMVCLMTGFALGADLAVPPSLLARVIKLANHQQSAEAAYFGVWNFAIKFNLAAAAVIALPLVEFFGYKPGSSANTMGLSLTYAALPCALKLIAGLLLWLKPINREMDDPI